MACNVPACKNLKRLNINNASFHKFPRNKELQVKWLQAIGRNPDTWVYSPNKFVCSEHFHLTNDYKDNGLRLKSNAVPSKNFTQQSLPKNVEKRKSWENFIGEMRSTKHNYLCSQHFTEDSFDRTSRCKVSLKENAVPTITVHRVKHAQPQLSKEAAGEEQQEDEDEPQQMEDEDDIDIEDDEQEQDLASTSNSQTPVLLSKSKKFTTEITNNDRGNELFLKLQIKKLNAQVASKSKRLRRIQKKSNKQSHRIIELNQIVDHLKWKNKEVLKKIKTLQEKLKIN